MEINTISTRVDKFIQRQGGYWDPPWLLAALIEELGELSKILQFKEGIRRGVTPAKKNSLKELIEEELGDILFAMICLTNYYDIDLEIAVIKTLKKYTSRENELNNQKRPDNP
ncbi:MAG: MazG nucleotide pyrophosphohydrolase domain-containing protein [Candidatus Hodarchaeales archaeon]|jgi:NTP pyrophosphatase (non-canonical NTP hydrolase)